MFGSGQFGAVLFGAAGGGGTAPGPASYAPNAPLRIIVRAGKIVAARVQLEIKVFARYTPVVPLKISVTRPRYSPTAPIKIKVFARYAPVAPLAVSVSARPSAPVAGAAPVVWSARVLLAGVDVSSRVTGQVTVEAEENAARVARLSLAPVGAAVELASLAGAAVAIDLELWSGATRVGLHRLFTGIVDSPEYSAATRVTMLTCSDARQAKIAQMTRDQVDALTPDGVWSPFVFDPYATTEQYMADRLSTLAGAVDGDALGALAFTPWSGVATRTFGESEILDGTLQPRLVGASSRKRVRLDVTYRRPQAVVRGIAFRYDAPDLSTMAYTGIRALTRSAVEQALQGSGATIVGGINWTAYPTSAVVDGKVIMRASANDAAALCLAAAAWLNRRYSRWIDERWVVEIGTGGTLVDESRTVSVQWDATENDTRAMTPVGAVTAFSTAQKAGPKPSIPQRASIGETRVDYVPPGQPTADDFTTAYRASVLAAAKRVAESRRGSTISFSVSIDPTLTLRNFVSVLTGPVTGSGKVVRVAHKLDIDAGSAITETEVECVSVVLPSVPAPVRQSIPNAIKPGALTAEARTWIGGMVESRPWDETSMFGFSSNIASPVPGSPKYPEQFSVRVPGIEEAAQGVVAIPPTCSMRAGQELITALTSTDGFAVGVVITGAGIQAATTIVAFDPDLRRATLSKPCTETAIEREVKVETRQYIKKLTVAYAPTITINGPTIGA